MPEPAAGTTPPTPSLPAAPGPADRTRAGRRAGHLRAVEEAPMTGAEPTPTAEPNERLAIAIQALFKARGLSLADPDTAAAYDVAVQAVGLLVVDGAYRKGKLGEAEHRLLRAFLDAAQLAPGYLTGTHTG